jgi:endonuclease/exonuclease/phosphatase family metal-dependent hydrolase
VVPSQALARHQLPRLGSRGMRLRVATYNVKAFRLGLDRVVEVVRSIEPDLLLVQESGPRRALRRLGRALDMQVAGDPLSPLRRRVKNAVLVRAPWRVVEHRLYRLKGSERFYPRGALVAQMGRAGRRVAAVSAHLGLVPVERTAHAQELTDLFASIRDPLVLGVDLNETPGSRAGSWISERYWDAWSRGSGAEEGQTFPSVDPSARIDYLFVSAGFHVDRVEVPRGAGAASDHLPVVADLTIDEDRAADLTLGSGRSS